MYLVRPAKECVLGLNRPNEVLGQCEDKLKVLSQSVCGRYKFQGFAFREETPVEAL